MSHKNKVLEQSNNKVCLEDLLNLKRHEKPSAEFWEQFDCQLKAKTLQSLAKKSKMVSWSNVLEKVLAFARKPAVPMSAAAVMTVCTLLPQHVHSLDTSSTPMFDGGITHFVQQDMISGNSGLNYAGVIYRERDERVAMEVSEVVEGCCKSPLAVASIQEGCCKAPSKSVGSQQEGCCKNELSFVTKSEKNELGSQAVMRSVSRSTPYIQATQSFSHIL